MQRLFFLLLVAVLFSSHDLFLQPEGYIVPPNKDVIIALTNGTFRASENTITRDRMISVDHVVNGERVALDTNQWYDEDVTSFLRFNSGAPGTHLLGVTTRARNITMVAEKFNAYLEHDGVIDAIKQREREGTTDQDATERYAKHVKTLVQVGDKMTDDYQTVLGYPIEFVPLKNPYALPADGIMRAQLLFEGAPLAYQAIYLGAPKSDHDHDHDHNHSDGEVHAHGPDGSHLMAEEAAAAGVEPSNMAPERQLRTDSGGFVEFPVTTPGVHYLRTIHLRTVDDPELTHASDWTTLTFEVPAGSALAATGEHVHADGSVHTDHDHDHGGGLPGWIFWVGSFLLLGVLFMVFNRRKA